MSDKKKQTRIKAEGVETPDWYLKLEERLLKVTKELIETKEHSDHLRATIYDLMKADGIDIINSGLTMVTCVAPTTAETLDKEALKRDHPDIYQQYVKTSERKGYLSVKLIE